MPSYENPTVLATRPKDASLRFLTALEDVAGPFRGIVSPAFENVGIGADIPDFDVAIFTSRAGVAFARQGLGRVAFCVGQATAEAAQVRGYTAVSAEGAAADLVALILRERPSGSLLHIRGETSAGDVTTHLRAGGLACDEVIVYRKAPCSITQEIAAQIATPSKLIIPAFSAETVSILALWPVDFSTADVVAISDTVATAAALLTPENIHQSDASNMQSMVAATARLIA